MGQTGTAQCRSLAAAAHQGEAAQFGPFFFGAHFFWSEILCQNTVQRF